MYNNIIILTQNLGSFGTISEQDKKEILDLLNSNKSQQRVESIGIICSSIIEKIGAEIATEIEEKNLDYGYQDNCHTWSTKVREKTGLDIVRGYLYNQSELGGNTLKLTAHSVVRDNSGTLVELTISFSPNSHLFIEHNSGKLGYDLEAQK